MTAHSTRLLILLTILILATAVLLATHLRGSAPSRDPAALGEEAFDPLVVHRFVRPEHVQHMPRLRFSFEHPATLREFRVQEGLDQVVAGARSDEQAFRDLMRWVRDQWEPGRPDPYPPPDARIILRDIRRGFTGGFCAQYAFVLVQAISSFGAPARCVTIRGHEVVEAWLADERRWTLLDPTNDLQVIDSTGRSLNAHEIHRESSSGAVLRFSAGHRCTETLDDYLARFQDFAVWIRNDFVSRPMNFTDFDRYRVWFDRPDPESRPAGSLSTDQVIDLYPPVGPSESSRPTHPPPNTGVRPGSSETPR